MSNHFTGLSLGPPLGDQRLDLCDLYAFQSRADEKRTVIILNANPNADALHADAIYRLNIDNDGDYLTDIAFSYVFSKPQNGRQTVNVLVATGSESRLDGALGTKIIADAEVSFGAKPNIINDRKRWLDQFVHLLGHTGNYTREEAIAAIDKERILPDMLCFNPSKPAKYPNGRVFTDDVIDHRLAFLSKGEIPPDGLKPHTDILKEFPYIGTPHQKKS